MKVTITIDTDNIPTVVHEEMVPPEILRYYSLSDILKMRNPDYDPEEYKNLIGTEPGINIFGN